MISQAAVLPTQVLMPSIVCRTRWTFIVYLPPFVDEDWQEQSTIPVGAEWCFAGSVRRQIGDFAFGPK